MSAPVAFYADLCVGYLKGIPYVLLFFVAEALLVSHVRLTDRTRAGRLAPNLTLGLLHDLLEPVVVWVMLGLLSLPLAAAAATYTSQIWSALPTVPALIVGMVFMELGLYVSHRLMHEVPFLWRFHRVHHSDPEFSPALTHLNHPLAAVFDTGVPFLIGRLLGIPLAGVAAWKSVQFWNANLQHTQIALPRRLDWVLQWVFILPRHHAIHHSIDPRESQSNYGVLFNFWDRVFGTFRSEPIDALTRFGVAGVRAPEGLTVGALLAMPWADLSSEDTRRGPS